MTTKTIGTLGAEDYTTIQAWEDACPSDLVTSTQTWIGQLSNQEFSLAAPLTIGGQTTSATYYLGLECASGASFKDDSGAATNPVRYNSSVGAGIVSTGNYNNVITIGTTTDVHLTGLQLKNSGNAGNNFCIYLNGGTKQLFIDDCILDGYKGNCIYHYQNSGTNSVYQNVAMVSSGTSSYAVIRGRNAVFNNCTSYDVGSVNYHVQGYYGTFTFNNCLFLGGAGWTADTRNHTVDYCTTDDTGWGSATATNSNTSATASTEIVSASAANTTCDLRLKSGATSQDAGKSTGMPTTDIVGQSRTGSYDIGCWEIQAGGTTDAVFSLISSGSISMVGTSSVDSAASIQSTATVTFDPNAVVDADVSITSTALLSWIGASTTLSSGAFSISSTSNLTAIGESSVDSGLSIAATALLEMVGASDVASDLSVAATAQLNAIAASVVDGDASISATALLSLVGEGIAAGSAAMNISSTSNLTMEGASNVQTEFDFNSTSSVTFEATETTVTPTAPSDVGAGGGGWPTRAQLKKKKLKQLVQEDEEFMQMVMLALPIVLAEYQQRESVSVITLH